MPMHLMRFELAADFMRQAETFLLAHEAEHNLILGLCASLMRQPGAYEAAPYLALVTEGDAVVAAALRTPPYNLVLSRVAPAPRADEALALIADDAFTRYGELPGVFGPAAVSLVFVERWRALTGQPRRTALRHERLYQLEAVIPVSGVPGQLRPATTDDRAVLVRWIDAFNREALGDSESQDPERWVESALGSSGRRLFIWKDGAPVSFAGCTGPTPNGIRIGPVYTPPERRHQGYASACVAALSQQLLDEGRRYCFLVTDLGNPTANHIYQAIGYRPVSDADFYAFGAA
jgi:predicted GNAT family acetyltransferase